MVRLRAAAWLALGVLVAVRAFADEPGRDFVALARAGVRPPECGGAAKATARRWERAEEPRLGPYCDNLARGYALLSIAPKEALALARRAGQALPGRAPPVLLEARAEAALRAYPEAWSGFEKARALGAVRVDAPSVLHAMAVSALRTGHLDAALESYRALVSRVDLLEDDAEELRILIETSVLTMTEGPEHISEAIGYLTEARRRPRLPGVADYVAAALAVAFDRQGLTDEANGVAAEATGPWRLESDRERVGKATDLPELPSGELDAMIALLAEHHDRELALDRWKSYLDGDSGRTGRYADWARRHRDALLGKSKTKRPPP